MNTRVDVSQAPVADRARQTAVVAIDMGYGHLRPARSIARYIGSVMMHADQPPLADPEEQRRWRTTRSFYENATRLTSLPLAGVAFKALLDSVTRIPPLYPFRDLSQPTLGVKLLEHSARQGLGRGMVAYLQDRDLSLLSTFYSPAVLADFHGYDRIFCVVTDSDVNRVWAPIAPQSSKIRYFAPSGRVVRRLRSYGVNKEQIELAGFPLPHGLVGGPSGEVLRRNLAARLARLDPKGVFRRQFAAELEGFGAPIKAVGPPHVVFAVGGAGAQADLPGLFLPSLKSMLDAGELRLTLVAGVRSEVRARFESQLERAGLSSKLSASIRILHEPDLDRYFERFDELLADTDVLWTKPSELVFYSALGIPLLLSPPLGVHESYNLRWAREHGTGLKQRNPRFVGERLRELFTDGDLAAAAWNGHRRLPYRGLYQIADALDR